jgi:DNA-binding NarL/FixJ family response regulator
VISVLIAADEALVREGCRALLAGNELIRVVGEAATGQHAVLEAADTNPDVVLLDIGLPGLDVPETITRIVCETPGAAVMLLTSGKDDERVLGALRAGAVGVLHTSRTAELLCAVQVLARGDGLLPTEVVRRLLRERARLSPLPPQRVEELTDREREVVALVAMGLSNAEIAERLVISPKTAKTHVSRAMVKVGARHRAQLVVLAYETGLVRRGSDAA